MAPAAETGVLTFGVFTDDNPIKVAASAVVQGARDPRQDARRSDIGVLIKPLADGQPKAPKGYVVGHNRRIPDCPEIYSVEVAQRFKAVLGHHAAVFVVVIAAPWECFQVKPELWLAVLKNLQDSEPSLDHFDADSVTRYDSYSILTHLHVNGKNLLTEI